MIEFRPGRIHRTERLCLAHVGDGGWCSVEQVVEESHAYGFGAAGNI
jgi:hypothetical protein